MAPARGVRVGVGVFVYMNIGPGRVGENIGPQAEVINTNHVNIKSFLRTILFLI
jgi:hypothetical protein